MLISSSEKVKGTKTLDVIEFECEACATHFTRKKKYYLESLKGTRSLIKFCSNSCSVKNNHELHGRYGPIAVECKQCCLKFSKPSANISKSSNNFCSRSCSATYNNTHKNKGYRKSKLEIWLQSQLEMMFPSLEIEYSNKTAICSELDIYIPSMRLAFEINGIFHYMPIFGEDKLNQIKSNDDVKRQLCRENGIELITIDTRDQKYFKESSSLQYLNIVIMSVNQRLSSVDYVEVL